MAADENPTTESEADDARLPAILLEDLDVSSDGAAPSLSLNGVPIVGIARADSIFFPETIRFIDCGLADGKTVTLVLTTEALERPPLKPLAQAADALEPSDEAFSADAAPADAAELIALRAERLFALVRHLEALDALLLRRPSPMLLSARRFVQSTIAALSDASELFPELSLIPLVSAKEGPRCLFASQFLEEERKSAFPEPVSFASLCFAGYARGEPAILMRLAMSDERKVLLFSRNPSDICRILEHCTAAAADLKDAWVKKLPEALKRAERALARPEEASLSELALTLCEHAESLIDLMPESACPSPGDRSRTILRGSAAQAAWQTAVEALPELFGALSRAVARESSHAEKLD